MLLENVLIYGVDLLPSGDENGANIQIYTYNGGDNQKWKLVRGWNGAYRFINARSG